MEFNLLAAGHAEGADDMVNRVMQRDNICIMAMLESAEQIPELNNKKPRLIVTNAHIHWDPEYRDVKVIQSVLLMRELKKFCDECNTNGGTPGLYRNLVDMYSKTDPRKFLHF